MTANYLYPVLRITQVYIASVDEKEVHELLRSQLSKADIAPDHYALGGDCTYSGSENTFLIREITRHIRGAAEQVTTVGKIDRCGQDAKIQIQYVCTNINRPPLRLYALFGILLLAVCTAAIILGIDTHEIPILTAFGGVTLLLAPILAQLNFRKRIESLHSRVELALRCS